MKSKYLPSTILAVFGAALISGTAWAQSSGTVNDAFQTARQAVNADVQNKVVSLYGIGTPGAIQKWYIIFYDPSVPSHGRAVLVENNQITKTYPANGGTTYYLGSAELRSLADHERGARVERRARLCGQAYDCLRYGACAAEANGREQSRFAGGLSCLDAGKSKGYVYVNALDDTVASYSGPKSSGKSGSGYVLLDPPTTRRPAGLGERCEAIPSSASAATSRNSSPASARWTSKYLVSRQDNKKPPILRSAVLFLCRVEINY